LAAASRQDPDEPARNEIARDGPRCNKGRRHPVRDLVALHDHPAADAIIFRQRRVWASSPFVLLLVVFIPALARGLFQRQLVAVVIFGALAALTIWLWILVIRRCGRLDIATDAITFVNGRGRTVALNRQQGHVLQVGGSGSAQWGNTRYLALQGAATRIPLGLFKLSQARQACTAKGWHFQ